MLSVTNVSYRYPHTAALALDDVTLQVSPSERVVLAGRNGSGKSTVAALVNASIVPQAGTVEVDGLRVGVDDGRSVAKLVAEVRQDPRSQLLAPTVLSEVAFGPRCLGLSADEVRERADEALALCGIDHLRERETKTLSGSQQQLLAIAGALAMHPRYLVLDEAEIHLDPASRATLSALVDRLLERGVGILHITHEHAAMAGATRVYLLSNGKVVWQGLPEDLPMTAAAPACQSVPTHHVAGQTLCMDSVTAGYQDTVVLDRMSLTARPGELTLLSGPSGSGKSTAAAVMAGVFAPVAGSVTLGADRVEPGMVGLAFQHSEDQLFADTVEQDVAFGPTNLGLDEGEVAQRVDAALAALGIPDAMRAMHPTSLSGGWRRRVALAGILALRPAAYVFDEPLVGLDEDACVLMRAAIERLVREGAAVVIATHDPSAWKDLAASVYQLDAVAAGTSTTMRARRKTDARVALLALLMLTVALFSTHSGVGVALALAMSLVAFVAAGARSREVLNTLRTTTVVLLFVLLASSIVVDGSADISVLGPLGISFTGLRHGCFSAGRIVSTVMFVAAVAMSVPSNDIAETVSALLRPFKRLGLPANDIAMVVSVALQLTPLALNEFDRIRVAQLVRGAHFDAGSPIKRLSSWTSVLVAMIVSLFDVSDGLARAMHDRCYNGELTPMERHLGARDLAFLVVVMLLSVAIVLV